MKPHKHAELIKAWADGAEIQTKIGDRDWFDCEPKWWIDGEYRIKPDLKPDVVSYLIHSSNKYHWLEYSFSAAKNIIKITRSGETGELIKAEVIK